MPVLEAVTIPPEYTLLHNPTPSQLQEVYRLRILAWERQARIRPEFASGWGPDDFDRIGQHWVVLFQTHVVAAIRMTFHASLMDIPDAECFTGVVPECLEPPIASYNRLVVHPEHRRLGLGKALDVCCINAAGISGASVLLGATGHVEGNKPRIPAMAALGFRILGPSPVPYRGIFEDEGLQTVLAYFFKPTP